MSLRSLNVKLIVPRKTEGLPEASELWSTHVAINRAVAYYEGLLLEIRGDSYRCSEDKLISTEETNDSLDKRICEACSSNGVTRSLSAEQLTVIRRLLRSLYEAIVPSSIGEKGDAQHSNAFISPLVDPDSNAFQSIFEKIGACPPWLDGGRNGDADAYSLAEEWLKTDAGKERLTATGAPPKWVKLARSRDVAWPQAFAADYDRKLKEADGVPTIVKELRERKVLPLFPAYLAPRIEGSEGKVSRWDRLAFRLAVGHLMSWESWCRLSADTHALRLKRLDDFQNTCLNGEEIKDAVQALRGYEQERAAELSTLGLGPASFRIRGRMIRSWDQLRDKWLRSLDRTPEKLLAISDEMRTKLKGGFGDPHLFAWLAKPEHHFIWSAAVSTDVMTLVAQGNALAGLLERSRGTAVMTLPDPIFHPRCAQWEPEGGSNLKTYKLVAQDGKLLATLPLLRVTAEGKLKEHSVTLQVARSSQLRTPVIGMDGVITFQNQANEAFTGSLQSADLLFDWSYSQHRSVERITSGDIGPAYLKLVIDITSKLPEGWAGKRAGFVNHFISALGNDKHADTVKVGSRILSVNLSVRCFAACSVFELHNRSPQNKAKLRFDAGSNIWAVHERSFMLRIPGEEVGGGGETWRISARDELMKLRRSLTRYRSFYRMAAMTDEPQRTELLNATVRGLEEEGNGLPFELELFRKLKLQTSLPHEAWQVAVEVARNKHKIVTGKLIGEWRKATRRRDPLKAMGKSMWGIEYLTEVRRILVGWTLLGATSGQISRLDRAKRGVYASRLLDHIDGIKNDRLKTGADLIVQAARGYLRDDTGKWHKKYDPCHAVLFEDLSRYRMKTDRPYHENSQLMRWTHRQMPAEVQLQGELYGIHTCETNAAFSSRFHAATMTPGVRCHSLSAEDLENQCLRKVLAGC